MRKGRDSTHVSGFPTDISFMFDTPLVDKGRTKVLEK